MPKEFNRLMEFMTGRVVTDKKTQASLGVNLSFQDHENRQTLDRWYFWAQFDDLYTQVKDGVEKLRENPKVKIGDRKERRPMRIFMPATRKDEAECFYCLYLAEAEKLFKKLTELKEKKPVLCPEDEAVLKEIETGDHTELIDEIVEEAFKEDKPIT